MPKKDGEYKYNQIFEWISDFEHQLKKAFILWGPPGAGKTYMTYRMGRELGHDIIEFNASDTRDKAFIRKLKMVCLQPSLDLESQIILLDEVDSFSDKKGLIEVLGMTKKPIIMTANNVYKVNAIRKFCREMYFPRPEFADVGFKVRDYRQADLMKKGSQGYELRIARDKQLLQKIKDKDLTQLKKGDDILLLDSSSQLYGWEAYQLVKGLACFDYCKDSNCLKGIEPKINKIHNVWFPKVKYMKEKNKSDGKEDDKQLEPEEN